MPAAPTAVQAYVQDGTDVQVVWSPGDTTAGFIIEAEANGGTYEPIGTAGASDTMFLATNLTANQQYLFEVIPYNSYGQGTGTVGGDPSTGDPVTVGSASAEGVV